MAASTRVWETQGRWYWLFSRLNTDGEVDSKKFALLIYFSTDFTPKATDQPSFFVLPQSVAARGPQSQRLRNQLYYVKVAQVKKIELSSQSFIQKKIILNRRNHKWLYLAHRNGPIAQPDFP